MEKKEEKEQSFHHFSHEHPLELITSPSTRNITCCGCNLTIESGKRCYNCKACSFSLHRVCLKMPRKIHHPSHPNHYLTLLVQTLSSTGTFKCRACSHPITGFCYNCAECGIYYHILCSALPLSVSVDTHPHTLKIEFSPPYDFSCDLCDKPSYKGWLYRCRFCEFDVHIACAISNLRTQAMSMPEETLQKQVSKRDHGSENNEVMQLILQGFAKDIEERNGERAGVNSDSGTADCDERLSAANFHHGLYKTIPYKPATSVEQSQDQDPSILVSDDSNVPSLQFSDMCFSIDLLQSYSGQANMEAIYEDMNHQNGAIDSKSGSSLRHDVPDKILLNPLYRDPKNLFDSPDKNLRQDEVKGVANGHSGRSEFTEVSNKSTATARRWYWKLLRCC